MSASSGTTSRSDNEMTNPQEPSRGISNITGWNTTWPRLLMQQLLDKSFPNNRVVSVRTTQGTVWDKDSIAFASDELPPWEKEALKAWTQGPEEAYACVIAMLLFRCSQLQTLSIWTPIASKALAFGQLFHEKTVITSLHRLTLRSGLEDLNSLSGAVTLFQIPSLRWLRARECQQALALRLPPCSVHLTKISVQYCLLSPDALRSLVGACTSITSFKYLASDGDLRTSYEQPALPPVTSEEVVEILASQDSLHELSLRIEPSVQVIDLETCIKSLAVLDGLQILGISLVYIGLPIEGGRFKWEALGSRLSHLVPPSLTKLIIYDGESDTEAWLTKEIVERVFASLKGLRSFCFHYDDADGTSVTVMRFRPGTFGDVGDYGDTGGMDQPNSPRDLESVSSGDNGEFDQESVFMYPDGTDEGRIFWEAYV